MNIGVILTYNYSLKDWENGGVLRRELAIYNKLFENHKINFTFFTYGDNSDKNLLRDYPHFKVIPFYSYSKKNRNRYIRIFKSVFFPIKFRKQLSTIDILHQHQLNGVWISLLSKLIYRKKLLVRTGYDMELFAKNEGKSFFNILFYKLLTYTSVNYSDFYSVSSKSDLKNLLKKYPKKTNKIFLRQNWANYEEKLNFNARYSNRILTVGRLESQKNYSFLLNYFANNNLNFQIDVVGSGSELSFLKKLAKRESLNINFIGQIDNRDLSELYKKYKYFISSSKFEGNPKSVLEAMGSGCIVICSNIPNHSEIINNEINGFLFNFENPQIKNILLRLESDISLQQKISNNSVKFIKNNNSINLLCEKMYKDYLVLLK